MSEKRSSVKVNVLGQEITIRSEASAEHTREVAAYVDKTIRQIMNSGAIIEPSRAAGDLCLVAEHHLRLNALA